jgi:hypothetical protein
MEFTMTYIPDPYTQGIVNDREDQARNAERQKNEAQDEALRATQDAQHSKTMSRMFSNNFKRQLQEKDAIIAAKDALILEWMHTNAAFKKLARDFANQLEIPQEVRVHLVDQARVDVAIEDPAFQHTEIYKNALACVEKHKSEGTS